MIRRSLWVKDMLRDIFFGRIGVHVLNKVALGSEIIAVLIAVIGSEILWERARHL